MAEPERPARRRSWTVEQANAALPWVSEALARVQALLAAARRERRQAAGRVEGNGHAVAAGGTELRAAVEALDEAGIVLRDLEAGLVDFPARLPDGREYLLCWVLGEPEVAFWHWPEAGYAGRRPLTDPPA
jgi:hypothetical protein